MAKRKQRNVFGLAFLDAMTCGLGAVVLLYLIINSRVETRKNQLSEDLTSQTLRLEAQVLDGQANLVALQNSLTQLEHQSEAYKGLSRRVLESLQHFEEEVATFENQTTAQETHLNKLQSDLKQLEEEAKRLAANARSRDTAGDKLRVIAGDGNRQYLTGLKVGGRRILVLLDASASMLDDNVVNIVRRRNMSDDEKRKAPKWRQTLRSAEWVLAQFPKSSQFQIYTFAQTARPLLAESDGHWLDAGDFQAVNRAGEALLELVPGGGTSLHQAFGVLGRLNPRPDNLILITDGLPTMAEEPPRNRRTVSSKQRLRLFQQATRLLPKNLPVNTILLPMEGDPMAAAAYWKLAISGRGALISPSEDWP